MASERVLSACRQAFSGFEQNDRAPFQALLAETVVFEFPDTVPYGGRYDGLAAYKALWAHLYATYYDAFDYDLMGLIDGGDHVVLQVIARATAKSGGVLEYEQCLVLGLHGDVVVSGKVYADTARLREFLAANDLLDRAP